MLVSLCYTFDSRGKCLLAGVRSLYVHISIPLEGPSRGSAASHRCGVHHECHTLRRHSNFHEEVPEPAAIEADETADPNAAAYSLRCG